MKLQMRNAMFTPKYSYSVSKGSIGGLRQWWKIPVKEFIC